MEWDDLRWLLVVVRSGSATSAASVLGSSPSTVTRRIAALEQQVGATLFLRTRDGLRPTETAQRLYAAALKVEAEFSRAEEVIHTLSSEEGCVRLATTEGLATLLVDRGLLSVRARNPGLSIEILAGNTLVDVGSGEVDLALRLMRPAEGEVRVRKLSDLALAVCASDTYLALRGTPEDASGLCGHDVLLPAGELSGLPEARWLSSVSGVRVVFRSSSLTALVSGARAGQGIAVLPVAWAKLDGLRILFEAPVPARPLWLALAPDAASRPAVRIVADRIAEIVSGSV